MNSESIGVLQLKDFVIILAGVVAILAFVALLTPSGKGTGDAGPLNDWLDDPGPRNTDQAKQDSRGKPDEQPHFLPPPG